MADGIGCLDQVVPGNIHRHIGRKLLKVLQQDANFQARAATKFNQACLRSDPFCHVADMLLHDGQLGVGRVVLRQITYLVEQLRSTLIVEILGRQAFLRSAKPVKYSRQVISDFILFGQLYRFSQ